MRSTVAIASPERHNSTDGFTIAGSTGKPVAFEFDQDKLLYIKYLKK